jgi:NAD(P)-dependent dehydrogenase (short-subunit alcohol dehydrogenase family)
VRARAVVGFGKYAIPVLAKSRGGSIVNMASIASKRGVHNGEKLVAAGLVNMQGPSSPPPVQQRLGEPIDIANLVLFLASDESKFIAEQEFIPDSGVSAVIAPFPS